MKKLNSLEELGTLMPMDSKQKNHLRLIIVFQNKILRHIILLREEPVYL